MTEEEKKIEELKAALKPFADIWERWQSEGYGEFWYWLADNPPVNFVDSTGNFTPNAMNIWDEAVRLIK